MDKATLKKFAIESRQDLMQRVKNKIRTFYIDEDFQSEKRGDIYFLSNEKHSLNLTNDELKKRDLLIKRIKELSLDQVIEEAAYTWFNRIVAIRYMEINDMLPLTKDNQSLGIRVLSSKDNTPDPEILKFTNLTNPDLDINFDKEKYVKLKDDNEKFKYILLLVSKKLGKVIPQVFDGVTDYIDILIPDNLLNDAGFITKIVTEVPVDNYDQVEIIGWLYQYYNQTEKDRVISAKKTYKKNEIAYATQLFTPDWIVKYMVENSLGRYWVEHSENDSIIDNWKYFIKDNIEKKNEKVNPIDITFIDPCCGSGHALVYAFEVLFQIYLKAGYNKSDISELILKNNLYGLDIDDRAGQLSILSILLKAREYDKKIFNKEIVKNLNIMSIQESNTISSDIIDNLTSDIPKEQLNYLIDTFKDAKEIGSLLILNKEDYTNLEKKINDDNTIFGDQLRDKMLPIIKVANILSKKFDIVVTNPPYMNSSAMSLNLKEYLSKKYKKSKTDLCTAFMEVNFIEDNGYYAMINQHSWMFLNSFVDLRKSIIKNMNICSMIHLGTRAFEEIGGEVVQTTSFVMSKSNGNAYGIYIKLVDIKNSLLKESAFLEALNNDVDYKYEIDSSKFNKIPGMPISYWLSDTMSLTFDNPAISDFTFPKAGVVTGNDNLFLKLWFEIKNKHICFEPKKEYEKYHLYQKGGKFRRWYGNREYVIALKNLYNKNLVNNSVRRGDQDFYFKKGIGWSSIGGNAEKSFRKIDNSICGTATPTLYLKDNKYYNYVLALLNTKYSEILVNIFNPTLTLLTTDVGNIPLIIDESKIARIDNLVEQNISISKEDWDSFETSWDFTSHPLIGCVDKKMNYTIEEAYRTWESNCNERFRTLKNNEEELNKIFIDIYGLQDELTPDVEDKDITVRKADLKRDIKSLISYAVGCMFGRYSLDEEGLIYAGGEFDSTRYKKFDVDLDNIIPITDEAYFGDDIVERFKKFISVVYGEYSLDTNLDFIAEVLGRRGTESNEDTIRRYFVNDFYNDHVKMYQKRPIYWLFDSGKKNGFKALTYIHRYNENLVPKVRLDYLHRIQTTYEKFLVDVNYQLTTDLAAFDKKIAQNRQIDLNAKLQEVKEYDEKIAHIANQRISIDLDDGVKVNYDKFKDILGKIK